MIMAKCQGENHAKRSRTSLVLKMCVKSHLPKLKIIESCHVKELAWPGVWLGWPSMLNGYLFRFTIHNRQLVQLNILKKTTRSY